MTLVQERDFTDSPTDCRLTRNAVDSDAHSVEMNFYEIKYHLL